MLSMCKDTTADAGSHAASFTKPSTHQIHEQHAHDRSKGKGRGNGGKGGKGRGGSEKNHPKRNKSLFCKNSRKRTELDSCVLTRNTTGGAESTSTRLAHTSTLTQRRPPPLLHLQQPENPRNHRQPQPRGVGNLFS